MRFSTICSGLVARRAVERRDEHAAVVLDVDLLDAGVGDDLVDDLAAGADDVFDLGGIDLDARSCAARTCESSARGAAIVSASLSMMK